jgi:mono/diheme cytochrome c family protein
VIQTIFSQNCVTCHSPGSDLNLQAGAAWSDLVNQPAPVSEACGGTLVVPGDAAASYLYQKVTNPAPCTGSQMPRTDLFPDPLPPCVIALIATWINEGAVGPPSDGGADR